MANLESKATKITLVIRKNTSIKSEVISAFCETYLKRYAWICHEKDLSTNNIGEIEGIHYHIVGELKERTRLGTFLNRACDYFNFDSPFGLEIDSARCIEACYQYLIHKNDKDKTPHDISEIVSNIPQEELKTIIETAIDSSITADRLEYILRSHIRFNEDSLRVIVDYFGIMRDLGLGRINSISWGVNNGIKQIKIELYNAHNIQLPNEY